MSQYLDATVPLRDRRVLGDPPRTRCAPSSVDPKRFWMPVHSRSTIKLVPASFLQLNTTISSSGNGPSSHCCRQRILTLSSHEHRWPRQIHTNASVPSSGKTAAPPLPFLPGQFKQTLQVHRTKLHNFHPPLLLSPLLHRHQSQHLNLKRLLPFEPL